MNSNGETGQTERRPIDAALGEHYLNVMRTSFEIGLMAQRQAEALGVLSSDDRLFLTRNERRVIKQNHSDVV